MDMTNSWKMYAIGSAIFAALTALFGKLGVAGIDSNFATWVRTIVIFVFLTGILVFTNFKFNAVFELGARQVTFLVISGICTGLSWLCYFRALKLGPASKVAPVDKLSVALAILLAWLVLGEKMTWTLALGTVLIVSGSLVILL
jgi:transporter family protein